MSLIPVRGHGVCSLDRETLLELRSEFRSGPFPATAIGFFLDLNPQLAARKMRNLTTKP